MKRLRGCFGSKEYSSDSQICNKCQFVKKCWKERKKRYPTLKKPKLLENGNKKIETFKYYLIQ